MKQLEVGDSCMSLLEAVQSISLEPTAILQNGRPIAVLLPVEGADLETLALTMNPQFLAILERSRNRQLAEGGVSTEEMRRRLEVDDAASRKAKSDGRNAAARRR